MTFDPIVIGVRLKLIVEYLEILTEFESLTIEEYLAQRKDQLIIERLLELMVQAALDINKHLLVNLKGIYAKTNQDLFVELGNTRIITQDLAREIKASEGLRNVLAHEYESIDPNQVFSGIAKALRSYPIYVEQISQYVNSLEQDNEQEA